MRNSDRPLGDSTPAGRALSHPTRVEILDCLTRGRGRQGMATREIAGALGLSAASLAYHLRVLSAAGLVAGLAADGGGGAEGISATRREDGPRAPGE